jgi:glycosyltransferase involved in cell wall biosynthesis
MGGINPNISIKTNFRYSSLFPGMYRESKNVKDVIRIHDSYRTLNQVGIKQVELRKKKLVIARQLRDKAFVEQLRKKSIIVANSQYTANQFSQNYNVAADRFNVIWPSVGFRSQESCQSDYSIHPRPYLLSVMSQRQRKDPVFVINSWAESADKVDLDLIVVGEIPLNLLSFASQKLLAIGKLRIYPHLLTNELIDIQKKAFASIFASRGEGFGLPLAESLFYGVPVIHNRLSVFEEVCGDVSIKFSIDDQDSLVQAILNLRQNESEYKQIRLTSWKRGFQFSHEEAARKWSSLLF